MEYDRNIMNKMADNLENYLEIIDQYVIIEGITKEEYDKAVKKINKLIKKLRQGKGDEVFNRERYLELLEAGKLDV